MHKVLKHIGRDNDKIIMKLLHCGMAVKFHDCKLTFS